MTPSLAAKKQYSHDVYAHGTFQPQERIEASNAERALNINSAASTRVVIVKDSAVRNVFGLKPTQLPFFAGDRQNYPAWRRAVLHIFRMDWNTFRYDDQRAFCMIYNALIGKARQSAVSFCELGGINRKQRPEDFLEFLDRANYTPTRFDRATNELYEMRMGVRQSWPSFFAEWAHKLSDAHCDEWADKYKIIVLRNALNYGLSKAIAGNRLLPSDDYKEWVRIVGQIYQQVEMARNRHILPTLRRKISPIGSSQSKGEEAGLGKSSASEDNDIWIEKLDSSTNKSRGNIIKSDDETDTTNFQRRAEWKSPSQIRRLREEGLCFRCERRGCSSRTCFLGPAMRPGERSGLSAWETNLPAIDSLMFKPKSSETYARVGEHNISRNSHIQKQEGGINLGSRMNTGPFLVNALLDDITMVQALADGGVICSGMIDRSVAQSMGLPIIRISPRGIETTEVSPKGNTMVDSITYVSLVVDGLVPTKLWLCVGDLD